MKKLAFVTSWFSEQVRGGAETALRDLTAHLYATGMELEILTTCVKEFASDWSDNYYYPGVSRINGITVRRFWAEPRYTRAFDAVNARLMQGQTITPDEETIFLNQMVNSDDLCDYIRRHRAEYSLFVFIPYMFGPVYFGSAAAGDKAVLIPCLHDEAYAYLRCFAERYRQVQGMIFLSRSESELAQRLFDLRTVHTAVLGLGVDEIAGDAARFRRKYGLQQPFLLYAGRKDAGKKVDLMLRHFARYKEQRPGPLKLVLIGGGNIEIPAGAMEDVRDLGFVPQQDKYDAYAAAALLCQPSWYESFSIVIMESWLAGRPVLVSEQCEVTKNFAVESGGGLYFGDYPQFAAALDRLLGDAPLADAMGRSGRAYVKQNFTWDVVVRRYRQFFESLCGGLC